MDFPIVLVISIDPAHTSKRSRSFARSTRSTHKPDLLSYSTNEYALDYNAPLCFVLAYFAEE